MGGERRKINEGQFMQEAARKLKPQFYQTKNSYKILLGAALGILVGLFFGEKTRIVAPLGTIYIMLLQVAIFPYIICTLLSSIGRLPGRIFAQLLNEAWPIYIFLIMITFGSMIILSKALPAVTTALGPTQPATTPSTTDSIINLIIPDNFFEALSNNYVPAVVIFCILFGIMLQRIQHEQRLFNIFDTISNTCLEYWNFLIKVAPIGTFLIVANIAGTINFQQLRDVGEFLILFFIGTLLLGLWLIPALISSLTKFTYREVLKRMANALIVTAATTLSILSLPHIKNITQNYLQNNHVIDSRQKSEEIIDIILIMGYPLAHIGSNFMYLFMLYAGLYFNQPITHEQNVLLPFATFLSSIGSPNININTVTYLASFLNLPTTETFNLYQSIAPLIRYGQIIISVMGFAFLSILITSAYYGYFHLQWRKFFTHLILVIIILIIASWFGKNIMGDPGVQIYKRILSFELSKETVGNVKATIARPLDEKNVIPENTNEDALFRIQRTGVLRVGFNPDTMPFAFINAQGHLVGFDVAFMYNLAQAMNVNLQFVPFSWLNSAKDLQANKFDIAIGGIIVSTSRLEKFSFTDSYMKSLPSLIVFQSEAKKFVDIRAIQQIPNLKIGVALYTDFDPFFSNSIQQNFPNAKVIVFPGLEQRFIFSYLDNHVVDAMMWLDTQSRIWTLGHPKYASVTPVGLGAPFIQAYMIQSNSPQFLRFLNYWLQLRENDGFRERIYRHWILVQPTEMKAPRWSIMNNVLGW